MMMESSEVRINSRNNDIMLNHSVKTRIQVVATEIPEGLEDPKLKEKVAMTNVSGAKQGNSWPNKPYKTRGWHASAEI